MGSPCGPGYKECVTFHISSMRRYAEELDNKPAMIKRREVVDRILKCANELEKAQEVIEKKLSGRAN